jgi:lactoylglutathione lyase
MQQAAFRLNNVGTILLGVKELARSLAFYRDVLGMTVTMQFPGFAFFDAGGVTLALSEPLARARPEMKESFEVVFPVVGVREACEALRAQGVRFLREPWNAAGPNWAANFEDPDGHVLSLFGPERAA